MSLGAGPPCSSSLVRPLLFVDCQNPPGPHHFHLSVRRRGPLGPHSSARVLGLDLSALSNSLLSSSTQWSRGRLSSLELLLTTSLLSYRTVGYSCANDEAGEAPERHLPRPTSIEGLTSRPLLSAARSENSYIDLGVGRTDARGNNSFAFLFSARSPSSLSPSPRPLA